MRPSLAVVVVVVLLAVAAPAGGRAQPVPGPAAAPVPVLAALAPPASPDDARLAVPIGPAGEVYEPDGTAWVRRQRFTTGTVISVAGRSGGAVVAFGEGVVYRLAANGWSAIRLHQKEKARFAGGPSAIAAVGRQLFALDRLTGGEPAKLGVAPGPIAALGSGATSIVIATDRSVVRLARTGLATVPTRALPRALVEDRWGISDAGAIDLRTGAVTPWPPGLAIDAAVPVDNQLLVVARAGDRLELLTVRANRIERSPIELPPATAVGIVTDRANRIVIALQDGRIAVRTDGAWKATAVTAQLPSARPGPPPAASR